MTFPYTLKDENIKVDHPFGTLWEKIQTGSPLVGENVEAFTTILTKLKAGDHFMQKGGQSQKHHMA